MSRLSYLLMGFLFLFFSGLRAQAILEGGKPNPKVDYQRLKRIDTLIQSYLDKNWETGLVVLVVKDNQLVLNKGYGYANAELKTPMAKDELFRIMSQTKALASTAIMILYDQGKLTLDEPISHFIPEYKHMTVLDQFNPKDTSYTTVPAKREITFRDLLTHSSGIDYAAIGSPTANALYAKAKIPSGLGSIQGNLLDKMKELAKVPLLFQPGTQWRYGLNMDLLGCLVEVISGQTLDAFLQKNLTGPLGMKDTYFNVPPSKFSRLSTVYTEDSLNHIIPWSHTFRHLDPDYPMHTTHYFSGGAGMTSTAYDYAIFLQMLLNGGIYNGHRILSPSAVHLMTHNQIDIPSGFDGKDFFGLGFGITSPKSAARETRNEGSFAWGGYYGTTYWVDPVAHMVCLIMTQHNPNSHSELTKKIENLIYSSLLAN